MEMFLILTGIILFLYIFPEPDARRCSQKTSLAKSHKVDTSLIYLGCKQIPAVKMAVILIRKL